MKYLISTFFLLFFIPLSFSAKAQDYSWDYSNHPQRLLTEYTTVFEELPLEGEVLNAPWSDDYWPSQKGGVSFRWAKSESAKDEYLKFGYDLIDMDFYITQVKAGSFQKELKDFEYNPRKFFEYKKNMPKEHVVHPKFLSPSEKYDLYMGDRNWTLTKKERERTKIMKLVNAFKSNEAVDPEKVIPSWYGLCHAWAPATILYDNPGPVGISDLGSDAITPFNLTSPDGINVPFGASDVKALLTIHLHLLPKAKTSTFLGSRCELNVESLIEKVAKGEMKESEAIASMNKKGCNDTNAGAFHVALGNLLGHHKSGFVFDEDRGQEVWNQAVVKYKVVDQKKVPVPENLAGEIGEIKELTTEVTWVGETPQSWKKGIITYNNGLKVSTYHYNLYIDKKGKITGGQWIDSGLKKGEWKDRPDFLWMRTKGPFNLGLNIFPIYSASLERKFDAREMWKTALKKLNFTNQFLKNSQDYAKLRVKEREDYLTNLKKTVAANFRRRSEEKKKLDNMILTQFQPAITRARDFIQARNEKILKRNAHITRIRDGFKCDLFLYSKTTDSYFDFSSIGSNPNNACEEAKANCESKRQTIEANLGSPYACLEGTSANYLHTCKYILNGSPNLVQWIKGEGKNSNMGTFEEKSLTADLACNKSRVKCEKRLFFNRTCLEELRSLPK